MGCPAGDSTSSDSGAGTGTDGVIYVSAIIETPFLASDTGFDAEIMMYSDYDNLNMANYLGATVSLNNTVLPESTGGYSQNFPLLSQGDNASLLIKKDSFEVSGSVVVPEKASSSQLHSSGELRYAIAYPVTVTLDAMTNLPDRLELYIPWTARGDGGQEDMIIPINKDTLKFTLAGGSVVNGRNIYVRSVKNLNLTGSSIHQDSVSEVRNNLVIKIVNFEI